MKPPNLLYELAQFTGTTAYYPWSGLFRYFVLTDGAHYLAETAGAYWLMDAIASHCGSYKEEPFVVAYFMKYGNGWRLTLENGNDTRLATQDIEYSDFPLKEITLYIIPQEGGWVILLPSEY